MYAANMSVIKKISHREKTWGVKHVTRTITKPEGIIDQSLLLICVHTSDHLGTLTDKAPNNTPNSQRRSLPSVRPLIELPNRTPVGTLERNLS
jgi:hypothetical protein